MNSDGAINLFAVELLNRLDLAWTFILLLVRYTGVFILLPGLSGGRGGMMVRGPAVFVLALVSLISSPLAPGIPQDYGVMILQIISEVMLGFVLGAIPYLIVCAVQTGAQIASTTMGLGMGNIIDPTLGQANADLARIMGDLVIILFLILGGHHLVIYACAGLGGVIVPGTFLAGEATVSSLIDQTGAIFSLGLSVAAPVLVALLLTNFVMGLISKAVPTVNIFIVSFPLTIGIGLILTFLALPELMAFVEQRYAGIESEIIKILKDATLRS